MMHELEKSDLAIVAMKPANNAVQAAAEWVEPRAGAEGNTRQPNTRRTQCRGSVSQGLDRVRKIARFAVKYPRWEPSALIAHARICAGGAQ
jgi:RNA-directed DNA polymerase